MNGCVEVCDAIIDKIAPLGFDDVSKWIESDDEDHTPLLEALGECVLVRRKHLEELERRVRELGEPPDWEDCVKCPVTVGEKTCLECTAWAERFCDKCHLSDCSKCPHLLEKKNG